MAPLACLVGLALAMTLVDANLFESVHDGLTVTVISYNKTLSRCDCLSQCFVTISCTAVTALQKGEGMVDCLFTEDLEDNLYLERYSGAVTYCKTSCTRSEETTSTETGSTSTEMNQTSTSPETETGVSSTATGQTSTTTVEPSSTTTKQLSSTTIKHPSSTTEQPSTTTIEQPSSTTTKQPSTTTIEQPFSTTTKQPSSTTTEQPPSTTQQTPSAPSEQLSSTTTKQPSSTATEISFSTTQQTLSTTTEPPSTTQQTSTTKEPTSSTTEEDSSTTTATRTESQYSMEPACPNTIERIDEIGYIRFIKREVADWREAQQTCSNENANLVNLVNLTSIDPIVNFMDKNPGCKGDFWVGLNKRINQPFNHTHFFFVEKQVLPDTSNLWGQGEPSTDESIIEGCVISSHDQGCYLKVVVCSGLFSFMCRYKTYPYSFFYSTDG